MRAAFYESQPVGWNGVMSTFGANALLHALWIGPMTTGKWVEWRYACILWVGPLVCLGLERHVTWFQNSDLARFILLYMGILVLVPWLLEAVEFPATSRALAKRILKQDE
uniref:Uncharacterized protein n=1 Tax=Entomoneis paludosa TaxID=265537 RepID=A0A7S2V752_9STRA